MQDKTFYCKYKLITLYMCYHYVDISASRQLLVHDGI